MQEIKATLPSGRTIDVPYGTRISTIFTKPEFQNSEYPIIGALVNNDITSLSFKVEVNADIKPITVESANGLRIYRQSLSFLLSIAASRLFPEKRLIIGHSLGDGYYFYFDDYNAVTGEDIRKLKHAMKELVEEDLPIIRQVISYQNALDYLKKSQQPNTCRLLEYRNNQKIPMYECDGYMDLSHGPLVPSTGVLKHFDLMKYEYGFLLRHPRSKALDKISPFEDAPILFSIYQEYKIWGKILNIQNVGQLNEQTASNKIKQFIEIAEALHNKKIGQIADMIHDRKDLVRIVLIAGPSSSGKTTFTKKLSTQLQVLGFNPVIISLDDYFLPRERTPRDEEGNLDFESLEAINIELLNEHLVKLFRGEDVEIPIFDFKSGRPKDKGRPLTLDSRNILLMEGIHGLNNKLTPLVPKKQKFQIYVSALTQLNLDDHSRIPTTDNRLLRRLVRDFQFRGASAQRTFSMWPSVRRGENRNIFPFQNNADTAFNSALDYELGVLKTHAEILLRTVKPMDENYAEAVRLTSFLENFLPIPAKYVPSHSILREFIGDSGFKY
jgi:uridine kinase